MTTREELVALRKEFEQYYVTHAFNYPANPIGSRDCSVMWEGFQAGAASRDAEIQRLQFALADSEALELGTAERCDQLREQVALLREALKDICSDYEDRFDMGSPSTNPGMKFVVKQAREAISATEPKIAKPT